MGARGLEANKPGTQAYAAFCREAGKRLPVTFVKVKGHSGDVYNDLADQLAKKGAGIGVAFPFRIYFTSNLCQKYDGRRRAAAFFAAALLDMDFAYRRKAGKSLQQESRRLGRFSRMPSQPVPSAPNRL